MYQQRDESDASPSTSGIDLTSKGQWLSTSEQHDLHLWTKQLAVLLPLFTLAWGALHVLCAVLSRTLAHPKSTIPKKDRVHWDNKVIAATHAAVACACGIFWFIYSGESAKLEGRAFVFLPINSYIAAVGVSYFLYDSVAMVACYSLNLMRRSFFLSIIGHHLIFIAAYAATLVYPCVLSVSVFHLFQLTELSTVFLHLNWMASKAQVQYKLLYKVSIALLTTFLARVLLSGFIVFHTVIKLDELKLWRVDIPAGRDWCKWPYMLYMLTGSIGMLALNASWFVQLTTRAQNMVKRVRDGHTPTPDYDRDDKRA